MSHKVTVDQLGAILMDVPKNQPVFVRTRTKSTDLNKNALDESGRVNPYPKENGPLQKVSQIYGIINFDWSEDRKSDTGDKDYVATRSNGEKLGGLLVANNGQPALFLKDVKHGETEWYLEGEKLSESELNEVVIPFKRVKKPSGTTATDNVRQIYASNIIAITIGSEEYELI